MRHRWGGVVAVVSLLLLTACGAPRTRPVSGVVRYQDGSPVVDAQVSLDGRTATTDASGGFSFTEVRQGTHTLTVSLDGRVLLTQPVQVRQNTAPLSLVVPPVNWAFGAPYAYDMEPHENYPDSGNELTDGVRAHAHYRSEAWVGHLRADSRQITLDLGKVRPIAEVRTAFLHQPSVGIRVPERVTVEVSEDGSTWTEVGRVTLTYPDLGDREAVIEPVVVGDVNRRARYVRVTIKVDVWVFLDEIEVWG